MEPTHIAANPAPIARDYTVAPLNLDAYNGVLPPVGAADRPVALAATGAALAECAHEQVLDAHGCDPSEYQWIPVLKKQRADGWSPEKQRKFIAALADTGSVRIAAQSVCMSSQTAYSLRRSAGAESFNAAWDAALSAASKSLMDVAMDRALNGTEEVLYNRDGNVTGYRTKFNDRLLMFMLRAHAPERYRGAHRELQGADQVRLPDAQTVPQPVAVAEALAMLDPVTPDEPYKLMSPDALESALETADILDGKLPMRFRDRAILQEENMAEMATREQAPTVPSVASFRDQDKLDERAEMLSQMLSQSEDRSARSEGDGFGEDGFDNGDDEGDDEGCHEDDDEAGHEEGGFGEDGLA